MIVRDRLPAADHGLDLGPGSGQRHFLLRRRFLSFPQELVEDLLVHRRAVRVRGGQLRLNGVGQLVGSPEGVGGPSRVGILPHRRLLRAGLFGLRRCRGSGIGGRNGIRRTGDRDVQLRQPPLPHMKNLLLPRGIRIQGGSLHGDLLRTGLSSAPGCRGSRFAGFLLTGALFPEIAEVFLLLHLTAGGPAGSADLGLSLPLFPDAVDETVRVIDGGHPDAPGRDPRDVEAQQKQSREQHDDAEHAAEAPEQQLSQDAAHDAAAHEGLSRFVMDLRLDGGRASAENMHRHGQKDQHGSRRNGPSRASSLLPVPVQKQGADQQKNGQGIGRSAEQSGDDAPDAVSDNALVHHDADAGQDRAGRQDQGRDLGEKGVLGLPGRGLLPAGSSRGRFLSARTGSAPGALSLFLLRFWHFASFPAGSV